MNKKKLAGVLGVLFGLYLIAFAVCCYVISIVLALAKDIDFIYSIFVFPVLGIATIVGAILLKKSRIFTRIIYTISTISYIGVLIFFAIVGLFNQMSWAIILFGLFAIIGIVATTFSYLIKEESTQIQTNEQ